MGGFAKLGGVHTARDRADLESPQSDIVAKAQIWSLHIALSRADRSIVTMVLRERHYVRYGKRDSGISSAQSAGSLR